MNSQTQTNLTQQITVLKKQFSQINNQIFRLNNELREKREENFRLVRLQFLFPILFPSEKTLGEEYQNRKKIINQIQKEVDILHKQIMAFEEEKNKIGEEIEQLEEA